MKNRQISAEIICDSLNSATGDRLTTYVISIPRFALSQLNTHRSLSKNCSSSRAIPCKKFRKQVLENPFVPIKFGKGGKGMQAHGELSPTKAWLAKQAWLLARYPAVCAHWFMSDLLGLSKEVANRVLEVWMWAEVIITGTEWKNFFHVALPRRRST